MVVGIRSHPHRDRIRSRRQTFVWFRRGLTTLLLFALVGGIVWMVRDYKHRHPFTPTVAKRMPMGTWCRQEMGRDACTFFDRTGVRWGHALRSSGPLLLLVDDQIASGSDDPKLFTGIIAAVDGLAQMGLASQYIVLPDAGRGSVFVTTKKGDMYFDGLGGVADQLKVLSVFLADRAKDPAFSPVYIDLRTPGRVYYK